MTDAHPSKPLQNRVDPAGDIVSCDARGDLMGNRGGRFHDPDTKMLLPNRKWVSRQWICCVTEFKQRHRAVMGHAYTELFFLDEVTALAAGHRPCFECRRKDAMAFAVRAATAMNVSGRARAPAMDRVLHRERLDGAAKRRHCDAGAALPDGTMVSAGGAFFAISGAHFLPWSHHGYGNPVPREDRPVDVLTPPLVISVLAAGYRPRWHFSARTID